MIISNNSKDVSVFIVGINSFVGSHLALYFKSQGLKISGSVRNHKSDLLKDFETYKIDLANKKTTPKLNPFEWIIYCAHDINLDPELQIKSYENLFNILSSEKTRHIFISSISASEQAISNYGKIKFQLEKFFASKNSYILRPGLVIGKGGLFYKMYKNILAFPITPLIDGGTSRIEFIGISDICSAIQFIINEIPERKIYNLISEKKINLYELAKVIRRNSNKVFIPFSIPIFIVEFAVSFFKRLKIPFPITKENLQGLKLNSKNEFISDLNEFSINSPTDFESYLDKMMNLTYPTKDH